MSSKDYSDEVDAMTTAQTPNPDERARRAYTTVLRKLEVPGSQKALAEAMGVSESSVSEIKTKNLEAALRFLAHVGFKVVGADARCMPAAAYEFLTKTHERFMQRAPSLVWSDEE